MRSRRVIEISAAIGFLVLIILFYQLYLQNIVILYVKDKNITYLIQKANANLQDKKIVIQESGITPLNPSKPVEKPSGPELPLKSDIEKLDFKAASSLYERYVVTKQSSCKTIRLGHVQDGGWDICADSGYEPRTNGECLVYSVGINNDFSFDDAISRKYGCTVHCFDPSMKRKDFKRSSKVFFHNMGLSNKNDSKNGWKMRTFLGMRKELGHSKSPIDVLKVDIEQWEHVTIPEMVASGSLKDVKQFAVEIHIDLGHITRKQDPRKEKYIQVLKGFRDLYDAGFRIVHYHCNPYCLFKFKSGKKGCSCHEVTFVNTNLKSSHS